MIEPFVVNKLTANGESCAHLLAKSGSKDTMEVTRYFLKSGGRANSVTNVPNGANPTALAINVMRNNYDVVELMLEGSVKTDVKFRNENNNEVTVMDLAFQRAAGKPKESPEYMMLALLDQYDAVAMSGQKFVRPVVAVPLPVPVPVQVPVPEPVVLVAEPLVDEVEKTVDEKIEM